MLGKWLPRVEARGGRFGATGAREVLQLHGAKREKEKRGARDRKAVNSHAALPCCFL